jgi:hypothetical protein
VIEAVAVMSEGAVVPGNADPARLAGSMFESCLEYRNRVRNRALSVAVDGVC